MTTPFTVGFANLTESLPDAVYHREALESAISYFPDLNLIIRNNNLDDETALRNAQEFATLPVDLAIFSHINERMGQEIQKIFLSRNIPVIAVEIPIPMATYFGAHNVDAGNIAGQALGEWIQKQWNGQLDKVLVLTESRVVSVIRERLLCAIDGLSEWVEFDPDHVLYLDSGHDRDITMSRTRDVLERWHAYEHIGVIAIDDFAAIAAIEAVRQLGREDHVAVVGHGGYDLAMEEMRRPGSCMVASTDFHMDVYGISVLKLAQRMLNGERVPQHNFIEHSCITASELRQ